MSPKTIHFTAILVLFFTFCRSQNKVYTVNDVMHDTLGNSATFSNFYEVEKINNALLSKYIYSNKSSEKAMDMVIGFCLGNIERYTSQLPEAGVSYRLNEAPVVFGDHWDQIEPLYTKLLAAIRTAITENPHSAILFENSALIKCTINDLNEAIRDMLMAINLNPTSSYCYEKLGYFYELKNEFTKSCESLRKARDLGGIIKQSAIQRVCNR